MKEIRACVLVAFFLGFGSSPATFGQLKALTPKQEKSFELDLRSRNREEVTAFLQRDSKKMAVLWSDDFVVTNPLNKFVNKKQVLAMLESGFLVITAYDRKIEYIHIYGDIAVIAGAETVVWGGKMPNAGKSEQLRFTAVWALQSGRWQEIARHANIVPPQRSATPQ